MALSASESALLTETCANMNVAANTCREVLEMLRNLGNTGVVDIATHNNSTGAHANDATIQHVTVGSNYKRYTFGYNNSSPVKKIEYWENGSCVDTLTTKTFGSTSSSGGRYTKTVKLYTTDSNGDYISLEDAGIIDLGLFCTGFEVFGAFDASASEEKIVRCGLRYYANRNKDIFGESDSAYKYSTIGFMTTGGTAGSVTDTIVLTYPSLYPKENNTISLGWSGKAFKDLYLVNAVTVTSDRRAKKDVASIGSQAVDFIKALRPVSYRLKQGEGHIDPEDIDGNPIEVENPPVDREGVRTHWGLIAQEVKEALTTAGIEDAALWCLADKDDPDSQQSLRYEELIAPMIKVIQMQQERIEALERKVA